MKMTCSRVTLSVILALALIGTATGADRQLAHAVFFHLKEDTPAARKQLVEGCQKHLSGHEGTVYFAAGVIADELDREVNDREFDVSLLVVFENKAAHDVYQTHPRHLTFIREFSSLWDGVRVFDSYLAPPAEK